MFQTDNSMNYLARSANLPICFTFRNFFLFKLSKAISGSTGLIFTIFFHQMEGICVNIVNPDSFSNSPSHVAMETNSGKIGEMTFIHTLAF